MFLNDELYKQYLIELQSLEEFRKNHTHFHEDTPLEEENDPYTNRIIESLAFYIARNKRAGIRHIHNLHIDLFSQMFPYLTNSIPSMGFIQCSPSLHLSEPAFIQAGTEVHFSIANEPKKAYFQTIQSMMVFPIKLNSSLTEEGNSSEFKLDFQAFQKRKDSPRNLKLHVNHLSSFQTSLNLFISLKNSLEKVHIHFEDSSNNNTTKADCTFSFGLKYHEIDVFNHPIEEIRSELHFPQKNFYLDIQIPDVGKSWDNFSLIFKLNNLWPKSLKINKESLVPFVVPIINLKKDFSSPIQSVQTNYSHPILHPKRNEEFSLHNTLGVYEILPNKVIPLFPEVIAEGKNSFRIEKFLQENEQVCSRIKLNLCNEKKIISIESLWSQFWFSNYLESEIKASFSSHKFPGINISVFNKFIPHEESYFSNHLDQLRNVLPLKTLITFDLNDFVLLLKFIKNIHVSFFKDVYCQIVDLKKEKSLDNQYLFYLESDKNFDKKSGELFFNIINKLFNFWLPEDSSKIQYKIRRSYE